MTTDAPLAADGVSYQIEPRYARIVAVGSYPYGEIQRAVAAALADPAFVPGSGLLLDFTASETNRSQAEVHRFAAFLVRQPALRGARCALCVRLSLHFGIGRMLSALTEPSGLRVEVFQDLEAARAWLSAAHPAGGPSPS